MNILFFLKPKHEIAWIYDNSTIKQALEKMRHHGFSAIPVIDRAGRYSGTLSEGDLLWEVLDGPADNPAKDKRRIKDILKGRQNAPVNVNESIEDLFLMAVHQNFIPVEDDRGLFIGIVTRGDILQFYHQKMQREQNCD